MGVDASLSSTGVASDTAAFCIKGKGTGIERMVQIRNALMIYVESKHTQLVVLEGLAYSAKGMQHELAGLHWILRLALYSSNVAVALCPPSCVKKFATGKGNVDKGAVLVEAVRRLSYDGSSHDEADALWLHQMGLHHIANPQAVDLPKTHLASLDGVVWPDAVTSC